MTENPLPGIPLVDSPLFPQMHATLGFTQEEERVATQLAERGYATLPFPDSQFDDRAERIKRNLGPRYGVDFANAAADKTAGERRIQDAWRFDEDVRAIASNTAVLALLGKLYGRAAFPFQTLNFPVGTEQAPHTDIVHFSSLPERFMCGVWVALEDITLENGPLCYFPGSHRWPVLTNATIGRRGYGSSLASAQDPFEPAWNALREATGAVENRFLARKGEALIWSANLLHGGSAQTDRTLTRWSQVTHYYFEDCIYYTPAFSDESLGQLHLRHPVAITDGQARANLYLGTAREPQGHKPRAALARWLGI